MRLLDSPFRVLLIQCDRQICLSVFFKCRAYSNPISSPIYHLSEGKNKCKKVITKDGEVTYYIMKGPDLYKGESHGGPADEPFRKNRGHHGGIVNGKILNKVENMYHKFGGMQNLKA